MPEASVSLLEARGLMITVGGKPLHSGMDFSLAPGELVAVTGPSGAGKTTLLRTVVGLQDAGAGEVLLRGRTPGQWGWPEFRRQVVLVSQKPILLEMSVEENLRRPFAYRSATSPFPEDRARRLMDELGVRAERMEQAARTLSVGQQQRVSLIRALLLEPPVLCLDEPTSALDPDAAGRVQRLISAEAAQRGLAALVVTHSAVQAEEWCSRQLVLTGGAS
jgi:putative ABC transport system ATP-binding protein